MFKELKKAVNTPDIIGFLDQTTGEMVKMSDYGVNNHEDLSQELGYDSIPGAMADGLIRIVSLNSFQLGELTEQAYKALDNYILEVVNQYPNYFKADPTFYVDSYSNGYQTATLNNILDKGLKAALKTTSIFAKKKKDSPLGYGVDELKEIYQGDQEELARLDKYSSNDYKYWVTPNDEIINIGSQLHNEWAEENKEVNGQKLLDSGWIRITNDQIGSNEILFDVPDFNSSSLKRIDDVLNKDTSFYKFKNISINDDKNFFVLRLSEVVRLGAERALRMYKKQINSASKEKRVEIPMMFLNRYFGQTLDTQQFNGIRDAVANVLEKNEHYFLDLGAEPREIIQLESEIKMAQTPGILDTALENMYSFGKKYNIEFKSDMQKGAAVTPSRIFHKLLTAWKSAGSPNWVPKIDRALENVSIEFNDSTKMSIFDDTSVDMFLAEHHNIFNKTSVKKTSRVKTISYSGYKLELFAHLTKKLGDYHTDLSTMEKLAENGYRIAAEIILDTHILKGKKIKSDRKIDFDTLANHIDEYNNSIGHSIYSDTNVVILKTSENIPSEGTDSENIADEELLLINSTVTALKNRGFDVTAEDYIEWMTGACTTNEGVERFNQVVIDLLTEPVYTVYKRLNTVNAKLRFELGVGPPYVDGIDLSINPEFPNVPEVDGCPIQSGDPIVVYTVDIEGII